MATITIRNLNDQTVLTLKQRAAGNNRSLEAEVRHLLDEAARSNRATISDLARRIRMMTPDVPQTDSTDLIREDRDRGLRG